MNFLLIVEATAVGATAGTHITGPFYYGQLNHILLPSGGEKGGLLRVFTLKVCSRDE